ncbi:MAG: hypothetical protein RMJ36_06590 [Candidatus Calescibacterium sp.]|nr:hypothetical protein [Candidatus Calescibacterium sp.]MDW8133303.1 hypothetical protein [Candidatus Calescibacterium sp.]
MSFVVIIISIFLFFTDFSTVLKKPWINDNNMNDINMENAMENMVNIVLSFLYSILLLANLIAMFNIKLQYLELIKLSIH